MKLLRVLFVSRPNLNSQPGGDTLHLEQNRRYLSKLEVHSELWDGSQQPKEFDLIHFYGLTRPASLLPFLHLKIPIVVTSIFVDYSIADAMASPLRKFIQKGFGQYGLEYLKLMGRARKGREAWPNKTYLLEGQKGSIQKILDSCSSLIAASQAELDLIQKDFKYIGIKKIAPLGIEHLPPMSPLVAQKDVLCVARIEPIKNQLNLVKAQKGNSWKLHLVGDAAPAHADYLKKCQQAASMDVLFHYQRHQEECAVMYNKSKVHVLPSYFESTGLASLEALSYGCQIVVNDHPILRELFQDKATYVKVEDPKLLNKAINRALGKNEDHRQWAQETFSWAKAARKIRAAYDDVLKGHL
jgi:glycosyltransferase involved in cell wall biosynthesis